MATVICYLLLVRPILTYAAPIWWNISASCMEKFRRFERSCLRTAVNLYRNESGERTISNAVLYNKAQIPRIYCFILKEVGDHTYMSTERLVITLLLRLAAALTRL